MVNLKCLIVCSIVDVLQGVVAIQQRMTAKTVIRVAVPLSGALKDMLQPMAEHSLLLMTEQKADALPSCTGHAILRMQTKALALLVLPLPVQSLA